MRNASLHAALRDFALEAASALMEAVEEGDELGYDVAEEPGSGPILYRYRALTAEYIGAHWPALAPKVTIFGGDANLVRALGSFCDASARDDVAAFFAAHPLPGAARTLTQTIEQINNCIALREKQRPSVAAWLAAR